MKRYLIQIWSRPDPDAYDDEELEEMTDGERADWENCLNDPDYEITRYYQQDTDDPTKLKVITQRKVGNTKECGSSLYFVRVLDMKKQRYVGKELVRDSHGRWSNATEMTK